MNRLLSGPSPAAGPESGASHIARLGPLPAAGPIFIDTLIQSRIVGRGGAGFAAGTKWRAVATHSRGNAVIVVNGAEGEPQSQKDRLLMSTRPHLILDGAFIAARVLRARRVMLYIGERHTAAKDAMIRALAERSESERALVTSHTAPARYVAGAESAAIHLINEGVATPTTMPPFPFERGIDGAPTLVQNVETLAQIALLARHGAPSGTSLITVAGAVAKKGVLEVNSETTVGEVIKLAGGTEGWSRAVLVGGYFGSWVDTAQAWDLPLDAAALRNRGLSLGCGVIGVMASNRCPVCEVAACGRIAERGTSREDLARLNRWADQVRARGACRHPDGAVMFLQSALKTFAPEFADHRPHDATLAA